jgi:hypothetical protein
MDTRSKDWSLAAGCVRLPGAGGIALVGSLWRDREVRSACHLQTRSQHKSSHKQIEQSQETDHTMKYQVRRLAVSLCPLLLVAACGGSPTRREARLLNDRLQWQLAPDIAAGNAVLQPLPDGARVTLPGPSTFPDDLPALDNREPDARSAVVEGLLDPSLMRIQFADTSALPDYQRDKRIADMTGYFAAYGLASTLQPAAPPQAVPPGSAPPGLTITISVACPRPVGGAGYGDGRSHPVCD